MKQLPLKNTSYQYLEKSFKEWLDVQGYAESTVCGLPIYVRELLYYLEANNIHQIHLLKPKHIKRHYQKLSNRSNQRQGGGLSNSYLNKHIQAIRKFTEYLRKVNRLQLPETKLSNEAATQKIDYLTLSEVQALFTASYEKPMTLHHMSWTIYHALQARDRAMLAIFYGCGLRRNEGVHVDVGDIHFDRSMLHVRKGKNYKQRFVPISKSSLDYLADYVYDHRPNLLKGNDNGALFITYATSKRMLGQSLQVRLKKLLEQSNNLSGNLSRLTEGNIGISLHTLRHSIATHLLAAGMKLENISKFLGHSSLESTQIYVHLINHKSIGR